MADNLLTLFCLIEGDSLSEAFEVEISSTKTVSALKKAIRDDNSVAFADVDAKMLTLWRVSIPAAKKSSAITIDALLNKTAFDDPRALLSELFPESPDRNTYIIVRGPARWDASRPGTPPTDLRADLKKIVDHFFDPGSQYVAYVTYLREFVQGAHDLPVTEGSISGLPCVGKRGLEKPRTAPSLMFFDLPSLTRPVKAPDQADVMLARFPGIRHLPLFGVSGCGKTRTAVDLLSRSWGFYFNAGAEDYGANDMHTLIEALSGWDQVYLSEDKMQNTQRIRCLAYGLLYARLLILEHCLRIPGSKETFSCQRWMLLQIATPVFEDVFQALFLPVSEYLHRHHPAPGDIMSIVQERFRRVQGLLRDRTPPSAIHSKFLVVLDESQVLGRLFSTTFLDGNDETIRPALAPIIFAFRRLANLATQNSVCVMPCGTGLSSYELTWSAGSATGGKLSSDEYEASRLLEMVVDFPGWTDVDSIRAYLDRLGQGLNGGARERLAKLVPPEAVARLYRDLRGRFRPVVSTIEDIIVADEPMAWEERIRERVDRLTTARIPTTDGEKRRLEGNLCGELRRLFDHVRKDKDNVAFAEFRNVEATLRLAIATFVTQGGYMAFKGQLPKLVETAFGRIKLINGDFYTTIDEPFAFRAADNYFQSIDPDYSQYRLDQLDRTATERIRGKEWEFSIPFEMVRIFHDKTVSTRLFRGAKPPHDMFRRKAFVVGWSGQMRTTGSQEITMADFLDAHVNNKSERDGQPVPPFFYPEEQVSGPDIVFVVRFSGLALDDALGSSSTSSLGVTSSDIVCPVAVQVKLCKKLDEADIIDARSTVQPKKIKDHGVKLSEFCRPHGHYISLIVSYPAEIANYFMDRSLKRHKEGLTEIALTIDDSNIDLFSENHVHALKRMKRLAADMAETTKEVKRRRDDEYSRKH